MEQPEGFVIPGKEKHVCRLLKSLYGVKQGSRAWNQKFHAFIVKFGLTQSKADPCVYFRHQRQGEADEEFTVLIIYVDDGIIFSSRAKTLTEILEYLKQLLKSALYRRIVLLVSTSSGIVLSKWYTSLKHTTFKR